MPVNVSNTNHYESPGQKACFDILASSIVGLTMGTVSHFHLEIVSLCIFWRSICLLEIALRFSIEELVLWNLQNLPFVFLLLSLETFIFFSVYISKVSGASKQKSFCRTSSFSTVLTGNDFFIFFYFYWSYRFFIFFNSSRNIYFLFANRYINHVNFRVNFCMLNI